MSFLSLFGGSKLALKVASSLTCMAAMTGWLLWDDKDCAPSVILEGHRRWVESIAFAPDGKTLVSAGGIYGIAGEAIVWDSSTRKKRCFLSGLHDLITCVTFSPDGTTMATASYDKTVKLWDTTNWRERFRIAENNTPVSHLAFSADSKVVVTGGLSGEVVRVWDVTTGEQKWSFPGSAPVAASTTQQIVAVCSDLRHVKLWDLSTRTERGLYAHPSPVAAMAFSPDGRTFATGCLDSTVYLWDTAGCQLRSVLRGHEYPVFAVAFSADGGLLASGCQDRSIKLWDLASGQERCTLHGHGGPVNALAFAPDGKLATCASLEKNVLLWNVNSSN
jgi:WD40 repeat protein